MPWQHSEAQRNDGQILEERLNRAEAAVTAGAGSGHGRAQVPRSLAEILRTPLEGDLLNAVATFVRKIMIYEAQSHEAISDSLKIGFVNAGMSQSSVLLLSNTKCDSWPNFVREVETIEHAKRTISAPTPMESDALHGVCHKCGKYGHTAKECRSSIQGGAEKPQCAQCGKRLQGQCWTRSHPSTTRESPKGTWKGGRKEDVQGTQNGGKSQRRNRWRTQWKGKGKGKRDQRIHELKPPEEQWSNGSWELWPEQPWQTEANNVSWREADGVVWIPSRVEFSSVGSSRRIPARFISAFW